MLEQLGITINLTDTPEYDKFADYYLNHNRLMRFLLRTFKWTKVSGLIFQAQCAELTAIIEKVTHERNE